MVGAKGWYLRACSKAGIKPHPARLPAMLPRFFVDSLAEGDDIVVDPSAGSNVTGEVAGATNRLWLAFELREDYLEGSRFPSLNPAIDGVPATSTQKPPLQ